LRANRLLYMAKSVRDLHTNDHQCLGLDILFF
jgi:hypothetical protein